MTRPRSVALVHDWLTGMRGGEKVLSELCTLFPEAPIHTLFHFSGSVSEQIEAHPSHTSVRQRLPFLDPDLPSVAGGKCPGEFARTVLTPVVQDQDLEVWVSGPGEGAHAPLDVLRFVPGGHDDGD